MLSYLETPAPHFKKKIQIFPKKHETFIKPCRSYGPYMFHSEYKYEKTKKEIQHTNQNQNSDPKRLESKTKQVKVRPELYDK
ncbi:hypothetical protein [Leptospira mayottensis]|uniref:hypothetical protein n=1 Tax=Leptospira mayottensis TaxID=1137606 RepID=UPI0005646294|nr:hypothetical protein [Leptospira mayottensis]